MKVLYLCNKKSHDTKMSRVRFHGMRAIGKLAELTWSGLGWSNYDDSKTVQENIDNIYGDEQPDIVVAFKPLELKEFSKAKPLKCVRYNEMFDVPWTKKEIDESGAQLVICHHLNDMEQYEELYKGTDIKFVNIPHCAEKMIYKDYQLPKKYDILLAGAVHTKSILGDHYPLRIRLATSILPKMSQKYRCGILQHPGGLLHDAASDRNSFEYAQTLNSAKICVTCSGQPKSRFGKYIEIPMCASAIAADIPGEEQLLFKDFVIDINMDMSDDEIISKLSFYIDNEEERLKLVEKGLQYAQYYTQERYADDFVRIVEEII